MIMEGEGVFLDYPGPENKFYENLPRVEPDQQCDFLFNATFQVLGLFTLPSPCRCVGRSVLIC